MLGEFQVAEAGRTDEKATIGRHWGRHTGRQGWAGSAWHWTIVFGQILDLPGSCQSVLVSAKGNGRQLTLDCGVGDL